MPTSGAATSPSRAPKPKIGPGVISRRQVSSYIASGRVVS
jgi:hypothetical protein